MTTRKMAEVQSSTLARMLANTRKIGGIAGIFFLILLFIGIFGQGEAPMSGDSIEKIRSFWTDGDGTNRYLVFDWLIGVAFLLGFLPFLSALRSVLATGDPSGGTWARLAFVGGVLFLIAGATASGAWGALAFGQGRELDDATLRLAMYQNNYGFTSGNVVIPVFLVPASLIILASGVLWKWLGYVGLAAALLGLIGALGVVFNDEENLLSLLGLLGSVLMAVFVLGSSIGMIRSSERETTGSLSAL
ncbi:MAG: hypothetical protein ABIP13_08270 [Tepidiformaceae bacterium]